MLRSVAHALGLTNEARFRRYISRDQAANPEDFALAIDVLADFHGHGGLYQYSQPYKLASLARHLDRTQPKTVLELGTGSTSVFLARYAKETGAVVTHVDESDEWMANTRRIISTFVGDYCSEYIVTSKSREDMTFRYDFEIAQCDLILVDGPALVDDGVEYTSAVCTDVLEIPEHLLPDEILIDMRWPTVKAIQEKMSDHYQVRLSDVLARKPRKEFQYFPIATRLPSESRDRQR